MRLKEVTTAPDYDPENPAHLAQYVAAGSPDLSELDADGNPWRPTIYELVDEPDPIETFGLDESDPLFETKLQILQAERAVQLAKEAEQKAAQEAAAQAAKLAAEEALTAKAVEVKKLMAKGKSVEVALATLAAKEPSL